jgi:hypothetical protein
VDIEVKIKKNEASFSSSLLLILANKYLGRINNNKKSNVVIRTVCKIAVIVSVLIVGIVIISVVVVVAVIVVE